MPYTKQTWVDGDAGGTPISAARLNAIETGIDTAHDTADAAETPAGAQAKVDAHVNDATAAHAASSVSFSPTGDVAATNVQAAIAEVDSEKLTQAQANSLFGAVVSVSRLASQSLPDGSTTTVSFDTEATDAFGMFTSGTPTRITIPSGMAGTYMIFAQVTIVPGGTTGERSILIRKNGATIAHTPYPHIGGAGFFPLVANVATSVSAGDYIEVLVYHNAGVAISTLGGSSPYTFCTVMRIGV